MAIIKKNELTQMSTEQLTKKLSEMRKELLKLNAQRAVGTTIESPGKIKLLKRTIAKLLTFKKMKSHNEVSEKPKEVTKKNNA